MRFLLLTLLLGTIGLSAQENEFTVKTEPDEVTIFINGAQVVRKKSVDIPQGTSVLKFTGLSPYMDAKSIQVNAKGEVMILSVNHQFNFLDSIKYSKELESLKNRLKNVENKIKRENVNIEVVNDELEFLRNNQVIGGKNQELSLNNFKQTADFYRDRVAAAKSGLLDLTANLERLQAEKEELEKQIRQLSTNKPKPVGEVLVKVRTEVPVRCDFEVSYFVQNAGWFPSYDIRVTGINEPVQIVYKANVRQNTNEEWRNVKLKLSSSDPKLSHVAPQLQTYYLDYNLAPPRYFGFVGQVSGQVIDAGSNEPLPGANVVVKGTTIGTVADANGYYSIVIPSNNAILEASYVGYQSQEERADKPNINFYLQPSVLELSEVAIVGYGAGEESASVRTPKKSLSLKTASAALPVEQVENKTAVEFEIKTPYTLLPDNKSVTVDIDTRQLDAVYEYYCVPKIDQDAFLTAYLVNWEQYNLLEGESNIFYENTFVGKTILDVRSMQDTLKISLGRDKNVQVRREKVKDFTRKQLLGSKKEVTRAWQISVKNNKKQPIRLNLFDQVPVSTNSEIEVLVDELSGGIFNAENGEVKWTIQLEPFGKKEWQLRYTVRYPRNRVLNIE